MTEKISPLWVGIGISGSLFVILLVTETALGRWDALLADGELDALAASIRLSAHGLVITGLIGFALAFSAPYMVPPVQPEPWNPLAWSQEVAWHRILLPVILVWQSWLVYAVVIVSLRMSHVASCEKAEPH